MLLLLVVVVVIAVVVVMVVVVVEGVGRGWPASVAFRRDELTLSHK